jgi:hypothetical protein
MDAGTRRLVRQRADERCEYCLLPQSATPLAALHIEHIIPRKHRGGDGPDNLALACIDCNLKKSSNLAGLDPETNLLTELFHPRNHRWEDHFVLQDGLIQGKTAIGRVTAAVLDMNHEDQVNLRKLLAQVSH